MTRFARCLPLAPAVVLLFPFLVASAQQAAPAPSGPVATLHTGTKLVVVDVVVRDNGRLLNSASRTLRFDLTPQAYADFQRRGLTEHLEISVPAKQESFLRVGIEEKGTGRIGAVEVPTSSVIGLAPPEYASVVSHTGPISESPARP